MELPEHLIHRVRIVVVCSFVFGFAIAQVVELGNPWYDGPWARLYNAWLVCYAVWCCLPLCLSTARPHRNVATENRHVKVLLLAEFVAFGAFVGLVYFDVGINSPLGPCLVIFHFAIVLMVRTARFQRVVRSGGAP